MKALDLEEEGSDILFPFVIGKDYEAALVWKNSINCKQHDFGLPALEFRRKKEKILRRKNFKIRGRVYSIFFKKEKLDQKADSTRKGSVGHDQFMDNKS